MKNVTIAKNKKLKKIIGSILVIAALSVSSNVFADSGHGSKRGHNHNHKQHLPALPKLPPLPKLHKPEKKHSQHAQPKRYGKHYNNHHGKPHKRHNKHYRHKPYRPAYDWARVVNVAPIREYYESGECYEDSHHYQGNHSSYNSNGAEVAGAIIGGVIGHQIGTGHSQDAATIGGAIIGAAIGHDINRNSGASVKHNQHARRDRWCEPGYERVVGYDVTYRYHGHTYFRRMDNHPGKRIKIRIN